MFETTREQLAKLRQQYPKGTKIKLVSMEDPYGVPEGTVGEVDYIDDACSIHMKWQNGSGLALIPGVDSFHKI